MYVTFYRNYFYLIPSETKKKKQHQQKIICIRNSKYFKRELFITYVNIFYKEIGGCHKIY